jgi:hypothetical protein
VIAAADSVTSSRNEVEVGGVDPDEQSGEHAELEVIIDGERVSGLGMGTADFAFEFLEAGFDFPSSAVEFGNFLNGEGQVCGAESDPFGLVEYPHNANLAPESFDCDDLVEGEDCANLPVQVDRVGLGFWLKCEGQRASVTQPVTILSWSAGPGSLDRVCSEDGDIATQTSQEMTSSAQVPAKRFPEAVVAEPAVAHNEEVVFGKGVGDLGDHVNSLLEFGLELHKVFPDLDRSGFEVFLEVVEASGQGKTCPPFLNELEEAEANDVLRPGVKRLVRVTGENRSI